jgi:hypothetical protein
LVSNGKHIYDEQGNRSWNGMLFSSKKALLLNFYKKWSNCPNYLKLTYSGTTFLAYNKMPHLPRLINTVNMMIDSGKFGNNKKKKNIYPELT